MASLSNEEIAKAGKHPGLEIWRIENMEMVPVPKEHYGHFFIGDSYIVLQTRLRTSECMVIKLFPFCAAFSLKRFASCLPNLTVYLVLYRYNLSIEKKK